MGKYLTLKNVNLGGSVYAYNTMLEMNDEHAAKLVARGTLQPADTQAPEPPAPPAAPDKTAEQIAADLAASGEANAPSTQQQNQPQLS